MGVDDKNRQAMTKKSLSEESEINNFAQWWLDIQCHAVDGICSALLFLGAPDHGPFQPVARWRIDSGTSAGLVAIAKSALKQQRKLVNSNLPGSKSEDRCFCYLAQPLYSGKQLIGVVAIQMDSATEQKKKQVLQLLESGSKWLALSSSRQPSAAGFYNTVVKLVVALLEHETFKAASTALITEISVHLRCERVSIGVVKGKHSQVVALSNSAKFETRANLIRSIAEVMDEAIDQDLIVVYPPDGAADSHIDRAHGELATKFGCGSICTIPLISNGFLFGAVTLERSEEQSFDPEAVRLCEQTVALAAPFLKLKQQQERWLIQKLWDSFKTNCAGIFGLQQVGLKLTASLLATFLLFASIAEGDFRLHADAILEGKVQRVVAAPMDGYIASAAFRAGDTVKKDDVLATLDDKDLKLEHLKMSSRRQQYLREYREAMAKTDRVQVRVLNAQIDQTKAEMELIGEQLERTQIVAPFDGIVLDGDLTQSLGSPVEQGEVLFKIAPLEDYRVVLKLDERLIAYVAEGQKGMLLLSSLPGKLLPLMVEKITTVSNTEEGGNTFRIEASLLKAPQLLRPGMEGVGKIEAGRATLIWIWTHELVDWLRLWFWSKWP